MLWHPVEMAPADPMIQRPSRLAILSFSSGEYDARSFRLARSALAAGYQVVVYSRWSPGQRLQEQRDGYALIRVPYEWRLAVPGLRGAARRRWARAIAEQQEADRNGSGHAGSPPTGEGITSVAATDARQASMVRRVVRTMLTPVRRLRGLTRRWRRVVMIFPLRPLGWAAAVEDIAEPADIWHGMWAGSLPALSRLKRRHGGRTIYDSRDVYLQSRDFFHLEWPLRPILAGLERRWAHDADQVVTVNEPYAELLVDQLGIPRPPVVLNCPDRWTPPAPPPDLIRTALGLPATTAIALYQGQLISDRGIEQSMQAILEVPGAILCLLGFGRWENRYRTLCAQAPYLGRVFVLPAVPPDDLLAWTASADVMVMAIQPTTINHRYTTPQKLWEAVAAGVPVVASDLPGMAEVIGQDGLGAVCDPTSPKAIASAIAAVVTAASDERAALRAHVLRVAHDRYTWEAQVGTLLDIYARLALRPPLGRAS